MGTERAWIVAPVHDNAATLRALVDRVRAAVPGAAVILVDDCSKDGSRALLRSIAGPDVGVVCLAERAGQSAAILAGLAHAGPGPCAVLDADLQDPPESLSALLQRLDGADVVFAQRVRPARATSRAFKAFLRALFPSLPGDVGLCFALTQAARERVLAHARTTPYLLALLGALRLRAATVPVERASSASTGYGGLRRPLHGVRMAAAALLLRVRGPRPLGCAPCRVAEAHGAAARSSTSHGPVATTR